MQSSFGHVVRAVVMLACLAVVPVLAIYGKQLQEFGRAIWETYQSRIHAKAGETSSAGDAGGNAPPWPALTAGQTADRASPSGGGLGTASAGEPQRLSAPWSQPNPLPAGVAGARAAHSGSPASDVQQASFTGSSSGDGPGSTLRTAAGNLASAVDQSVGEAPAGTSGATTTQSPAAGGSSCTIEFRRIEQRLRELGSTYYLLETWGPSGDRYRFVCRMALTGNTDYGADRIFHATDSDPLRAMQNVLEQVEQWRAGRSQ